MKIIFTNQDILDVLHEVAAQILLEHFPDCTIELDSVVYLPNVTFMTVAPERPCTGDTTDSKAVHHA